METNTFDVVCARGVALVLAPNKTLISTLPRYLARRTEHFDDDHKNFRVAELRRLIVGELSLDTVRFGLLKNGLENRH